MSAPAVSIWTKTVVRLVGLDDVVVEGDGAVAVRADAGEAALADRGVLDALDGAADGATPSARGKRMPAAPGVEGPARVGGGLTARDADDRRQPARVGGAHHRSTDST